MTIIDFALAWDFIDPADGVPRQLRFESNDAPCGDLDADGIGQLVAVVTDDRHAEYGHTIAISQPNVLQSEVDRALAGWQTWAMITSTDVNLAQISRRIYAAGLAPGQGDDDGRCSAIQLRPTDTAYHHSCAA